MIFYFVLNHDQSHSPPTRYALSFLQQLKAENLALPQLLVSRPPACMLALVHSMAEYAVLLQWHILKFTSYLGRQRSAKKGPVTSAALFSLLQHFSLYLLGNAFYHIYPSKLEAQHSGKFIKMACTAWLLDLLWWRTIAKSQGLLKMAKDIFCEINLYRWFGWHDQRRKIIISESDLRVLRQNSLNYKGNITMSRWKVQFWMFTDNPEKKYYFGRQKIGKSKVSRETCTGGLYDISV